MKWQWFLGGRVMFWVSIILFIILILSFGLTYVVDITTISTMRKQNVDTTSIQFISEKYIKDLGIKISKPVVYKFVRYIGDRGCDAGPNEQILLGTFHEWNDTYYIDISIDLYRMYSLEEVVVHETRHMIVQELKNKNIIDLTKYTEEIARESNDTYNAMFDSGVKLLKESLEEK